MDSPVSVKAALLQALIQGEAFGAEVIERVKTRSKGKLVLGQGSAYPALREMEREGLLKSREGDPMPERGGRPRIYYKLTAAGSKAAMEHREVVGGLFLVPAEGR